MAKWRKIKTKEEDIFLYGEVESLEKIYYSEICPNHVQTRAKLETLCIYKSYCPTLLETYFNPFLPGKFVQQNSLVFMH